MEVDNTKLTEDTLKTYNEVLHKNQKWKKGYWDGSIGEDRAKICTQYLCETILQFKDWDFECHITKHMFIKHKLGIMVNKVYGGSPDKAVIDAFPEKENIILRREKKAQLEEEIIALVPKATKCEETRKEITEKVISYLDCEEKDIPKRLSHVSFSSFKWDEFLEAYYHSSAFRCIRQVRPGVFKPWEFDQGNIRFSFRTFIPYYSKEVPKEYFERKDNRYDAVVWLLERLRAEGKKVRDLNVKMIQDYGLFSLMNYYQESVFSMIDEFFEGQTKPWQFQEHGSREYWSTHPDIAKEGVLFLINKLELTKETITNLTLQDFTDHYLDTMLYTNYNGLIFFAIDSVYPNEFTHLKWCFHDIPEDIFHQKENRQEAIRDLVERMGINKEDIPIFIIRKLLMDNGFDYILNQVHKGNVFLVLNEAFPQQFHKEDFVFQEEVQEYIDIFKDGNPSKLSFSDTTKEGIQKGIEKLGEIFTINTNSWVGQKKLKPFVEKVREIESTIYKELVKGNISIYEFEYDEPNEPKEEDKDEVHLFNRLASHSQARYFNVVWLYWRAYHFFKHFQLHLQLDSVYMGLGKEEYDNRRCYYVDEDEDEQEYRNFFRDTIDKYHSIVRCGELEVDRFYSEVILSGMDCMWVFPFEEEIEIDKNDTTKKIKAYLLQVHHDAKIEIRDKTTVKFSDFASHFG